MRPPTPVEQRFWPKVNKDTPGGCWEWTAAKRPDGYGVIGRGGRGTGNERAHRLSWILHYGEIPDGLFVCHKCDNRGCVNPEHLFLGDAKDNSHDCRDKERNARGETTYSKLTVEQVIEIRARAAAGESQRRIARDYPVGHSMVGFIVNRKRWKHV